MAIAKGATAFESFFKSLVKDSSFALLTDYDGTLAPFTIDRGEARPYPQVPALLSRLADNGVRVVIVSGRAAHEVHDLLGIRTLEVWGSHGAERLLPTGEYVRIDPPPPNDLDLLIEALDAEGLSGLLEVKPFGIAVHWRGLPARELAEVCFATARVQQSLEDSKLTRCEFDGGVEFRSPTISKANAVKTIQGEQPNIPILYMGDDFTDEEAFRALEPSDLSILVRTEYRPTSAHLWLKPPEQLLEMLNFLASLTGGEK